jgi:hypothetical protein
MPCNTHPHTGFKSSSVQFSSLLCIAVISHPHSHSKFPSLLVIELLVDEKRKLTHSRDFSKYSAPAWNSSLIPWLL